MPLQYGVNITSSDMKNMLEKNDKLQSGIRTWRQLFGGASLGYEAQKDKLTSDYSDIMAQAYKSNFTQRNALMGAGLNIGATQGLVDLSQQDLMNTYDKYLQNYGQDMATAGAAYGEEVAAIDTALTQRAENFADLYSGAYDYLANELAGGTYEVDDLTKPIYDKKTKELIGYEKRSLDYLSQNKLDWLRDKEGNLLSWNQLSNKLFNEEGMLSDKGQEFFDAMFNAQTQGYLTEKGESVRGFDEWLAGTDAELRDWYVSPDYFNYNLSGMNRGTANLMLGSPSRDDTYTPLEYMKYEQMGDFTPGEEFTALQAESDKRLEAYRQQLIKSGYDIMGKPIKGPSMKPMDNAASYKVKEAQLNMFSESLKKELSSSEAYKKNEEEWQAYSSKIETDYAQLQNAYAQQIGTDLYNKFVRENRSLYREFDEAMNAVKEKGSYDASLSKTLTKAYNRLMTSLSSYAKSNKKSTSGF